MADIMQWPGTSIDTSGTFIIPIDHVENGGNYVEGDFVEGRHARMWSSGILAIEEFLGISGVPGYVYSHLQMLDNWNSSGTLYVDDAADFTGVSGHFRAGDLLVTGSGTVLGALYVSGALVT